MEKFIEKVILKSCLQNKFYSSLLHTIFTKENFDNPYIAKVVEVSLKHHTEFKSLPSVDIILEKISTDDIEPFKDVIDKSLSVDVKIDENGDYSDLNYAIEETDKYWKKQSLKNAIVDSVDIIGDDDEKEITPDDYNKIKDKVEDSLTSSMKRDIGLNYFDDMGDRLRAVFNNEEIKVPTYYTCFDEFINGGIGSYSLSVILGKIHGFKSGLMANIASRQVINGKNVCIFSLEMSENAYAQRHDAIFTKMDINRMYVSRTNRTQLMKILVELKKDPDRGNLFIKQYPTGEATVSDLRVYLNEMRMRGFNFDIIYVDYMNLMKPARGGKAGDMYTNVKRIAEELRALSYDYNGIPVVSASQLNREGAMTDFSSVNMFYTGESVGVPATSDFMIILGLNEDDLVYKSELHYKIAKNRFGGRIDEIGKFYSDQKTLKLYDSSEMDEWKSDANVTEDDLYRRRGNQQRQERGRTV